MMDQNKEEQKLFRIFLFLTLFYALLIFYLSSLPKVPGPSFLFNFIDSKIIQSIIHFLKSNGLSFILYTAYPFYRYPDKVEHIILYAGFGFLIYKALKHSKYPLIRNYAFIFAIAIGLTYGLTDEFHQFFVHGRTASLKDLMADGIGVVIAQTLVFIKKK